jgi:hypothetical protein
MLSATNKPLMLSVIMLNVAMLNVVMLSVLAPREPVHRMGHIRVIRSCGQNKLECLYPACFLNILKYLMIRPGAFPKREAPKLLHYVSQSKLECFSLGSFSY